MVGEEVVVVGMVVGLWAPRVEAVLSVVLSRSRRICHWSHVSALVIVCECVAVLVLWLVSFPSAISLLRDVRYWRLAGIGDGRSGL